MLSYLLSKVLTGINVMSVMIFYAVLAVPTREIKTNPISNPVLMITSLSLPLPPSVIFILAHWCQVPGPFHFASFLYIFI
jgi:hypothetical protein